MLCSSVPFMMRFPFRMSLNDVYPLCRMEAWSVLVLGPRDACFNVRVLGRPLAVASTALFHTGHLAI